jgi:hypothetical protein
VSFTVTLNEQVAVLPLASVTTKVFVVTPIGNTEPDASPTVCVITCPGQLSVDVLVYVTTAPHTPASLLTVIGALHVIVGACVSFTVTVNEQVAVLPDASVTTNVLVVTPIGNTEPDASPTVCVITCPGQLSVDVLVYVTTAPQLFKSLLTTIGALHVIVGACVSLTVTLKLQVAVLPLASVTTNVLVVTPIGNTEPDANPAVCVITCPGQLSVDVLVYVTTAPQTPASLLTVIGALHVIVGA